MSEIREQLLDALVKPLEGNFEKRETARKWLGERVLAESADFDAPLHRLRSLDGHRSGRLFKWVWLGLLIASIIGALSFVPLIRALRLVPGTLTDTGALDDTNYFGQLLAKRLNADSLLLIGDPKKSVAQQKEHLWKSDPENPAYFAEYALHYHEARKILPRDFFEISNRIDPDNAWFDLFAASSLSRKSVERVKRTTQEKAAKMPQKWKILDQDRMKESLGLIRGARGKNRLQSYEEHLMRKRIPLLPQGNFIERVASISHAGGTSSSMISIRNSADVIAARAWQLGEANDVEGFRELREDGLHLIDLLVHSEDVSLINQLIVLSSSSIVSRSLQATAIKLGVSQESPRLEKISAGLERYYDRRQEWKKSRTGNWIKVEKYGSLLASVAIPAPMSQVEFPPPVSEADLKPGRLAEYSVVSALCSLGIWLSLSLCLLVVFLFRYRISSPLRAVSERLALLLQPGDWLWILGAGVLLPIVFVIGLTLFTPFGGNEEALISLLKKNINLPVACYVILFQLLLIVPVLIIRCRFAIRGKALGFPVSQSGIGWIAVVGMLVVLFGYIHSLHPAVLLICLLFPQIWLLVICGRALFSGLPQLLFRAAMARVMVPCLIFAMVCSVITAFGFKGLHQYWFERDDLMRLKADAPGLTPYEYRVAEQLRAEIRAAIGE